MDEQKQQTAAPAAPAAPSTPGAAGQFWGMPENTFAMLMHLSQFAGALVPFAGIILPIVMWQTNKGKSALVDETGKNLANWFISLLIYGAVCMVLTVVLGLGVLLGIGLGIAGIVFVVMGALKANEGKVYSYPIAIKFLK